MKMKGFVSSPSLEQIKAYLKLSPRQRLLWLEEANKFSHEAIKGKRKIIWENFRRGLI